MKRVVTPLFISLMLVAGWAQSQSATGDIRESTDPSRAREVEQKAQRLGDTVSPADQSSGVSTGGSDSSTGATGAPTGTEDMSGAQKPYGSTPGAGDTSGAPAAAPGASGTSGTSGTSDTSPGAAGPSSGSGLKSGPEAGGMGGMQPPERQEQRFKEPTQPAR